MGLTFTYDLEDSRPDATLPERFTVRTHEILDRLDARSVSGSFFVVGELAVNHPDLVREIAARGHEIGLHGWRHVPLDRLDPATFGREVTDARARLEDLAGAAVVGFRAPIFSLVEATAWAADELAAAGFTYSSSVLPAPSPLYGMPTAPRRPFQWGSGLDELPCPVAGRGRVAVPYLGGVYLRYLPMPLVMELAGRVPDAAVAWIYCHPYDFDPDEPFAVVPHAGWATSRVLHARRRSTLRRIEQLLDRFGAAPPLRDRIPRPAGSATGEEASARG